MTSKDLAPSKLNGLVQDSRVKANSATNGNFSYRMFHEEPMMDSTFEVVRHRLLVQDVVKTTSNFSLFIRCAGWLDMHSILLSLKSS